MIKEINELKRQANLTVEGHHEMLSEAINLEFCDLMFEYDSLMRATQRDETLTIEERNDRMNAFRVCLDAIMGIEDALQIHSNSHYSGL